MPKKKTTAAVPATESTEPTGSAVKPLVIKAPNFRQATFCVLGNAPLVIHRFGEKAREQMRQKQTEGDTGKKGRAKKAPKDFEGLFKEARHISTEGWDGISAAAFRNAMIDVCTLLDYNKRAAKMCIFVQADGIEDTIEGQQQLVKIISPEPPKRIESMVRIGGLTKTTDISVRAQYTKWGAKVTIRYDADVFTAQDIGNLLAQAGAHVGIGEGRPASTTSNGMGWGTFDVVDPDDIKVLMPR